MPSLLPKYGIGSFPNRQDTESAFNALQTISAKDRISVVTKNKDEKDRLAISENEFIQNRTIRGIAKGGLTAGSLGGIVGLLFGLGILSFPGISPIAVVGLKSAVVGMLAGGFYGVIAGIIIGAMLGNGISRQQIKVYSDRLNEGDHLLIIEGNKNELLQAESILKNHAIKNWKTYQAT